MGVMCAASRLIWIKPAGHPRAAAPGRPTETSTSEADGQERSRTDQLDVPDSGPPTAGGDALRATRRGDGAPLCY